MENLCFKFPYLLRISVLIILLFIENLCSKFPSLLRISVLNCGPGTKLFVWFPHINKYLICFCWYFLFLFRFSINFRESFIFHGFSILVSSFSSLYFAPPLFCSVFYKFWVLFCSVLFFTHHLLFFLLSTSFHLLPSCSNGEKGVNDI